ncbi:MOSC domain-containing protein [Variovorax sp. VNK109]|jgi:MOSC domain-containing protein YiiM|uniref:MOSC domain-containing protein n=1 Tax=Variovorax sp. VNK109 TaxID=3400919 RepID=UPI003BFB47CD
MSTGPASVVGLHLSGTHSFSKQAQKKLSLIEGIGIEGDAHAGVTVKHRSRVARNPNQPNLRQVHLMHAELFDELAGKGFAVKPGDLGENITTQGLDLLALPSGTRLRIGNSVLVQLTGLRNPCAQIDRFQSGLMHAVLDRTPEGGLVRKAGVMGVVLNGGDVMQGDAIQVELPVGPHRPLEPV